MRRRLSNLHGAWRIARPTSLALAWLAGVAIAAAPIEEPAPTAWLAAFTRPPLDPPLVITGGFGEYRIGHFHAGFDFGTGGRVGAPVYAPVGGWVERIRASGVGYGRSIYLHTDDGRLLQFGHLDAYTDALADYVAAVQESSGQYEQDLWPEARRFRFQAGDRIAWTGESGAGGPHMHFEIRRGDIAYQPMRAGLVATDTTKPTLASLTLEPLDGESRIEGGVRPRTFSLTSGPDTIRAVGRLRTIVAARDGVWQGVDRMIPWSTRMEWNGEWVDARFDSISWATDMVESDYVFDAGRVIGEKGIVLWAPGGWRPRVLITNVPRERDAGTITIAPGDPPRPLKLVTRDGAGNRVERSVFLVGMRATPGAPPPLGKSPSTKARADASQFELAALPHGWVRVVYRGAPRGSRNVRMGSQGGWSSAFFEGGAWRAIVKGFTGLTIQGETDSSAWEASTRNVLGVISAPRSLTAGVREGTMEGQLDQGFVFSRPDDATFDGAWMYGDELDSLTGFGNELVPVQKLARIGPESVPMRKPLELSISRKLVADTTGVGLYCKRGGDWDWVRWTPRADRRGWDATPSRLGDFALLRDSRAPRITVAKPAARPKTKPAYSRWAVEARLVDGGSGVDARAAYFVVDGKRVPSEWDSEEGVLRWRPRRVPKSGTHRYVVVATDRVGNAGRLSGSFVLD